MAILTGLHKTPVGGRGAPAAFLYGGLPLMPQAPAADPVPRQFPVAMILGAVGKFRLTDPLHLVTAPIYLRIFGVTRDSTGAALGGCTVHLFRTADNLLTDSTVSDGSGNYEFRTAGLSETYFVRAYLPGSPDAAGTTINTLIGS